MKIDVDDKVVAKFRQLSAVRAESNAACNRAAEKENNQEYDLASTAYFKACNEMDAIRFAIVRSVEEQIGISPET